tara:strand:+ start:1095 stop:2099 length:1005 start_codon:yes stop_codon:yes gene_type:complete
MASYEKFYTKTFDFIIETMKSLKTISNKLIFIDTSCGNNELVETLKKENIIDDYVSFDISPPENHFGNIIIKDWLREKTTQTKESIVGFNPPYGYGSKKAKAFIYKGFLENHPYCIWLVPISLETFLNKLYIPLHIKKFCQMKFINAETRKDIKQSVILYIGQRRDNIENPSIFLSRLKPKKKSKYDYLLKRTHNEGIADNVSFILKKTGNPVFFPSFYCPDISKNIWWQINKTGIIFKNASLMKKNNKYIMSGKKITKHTEKNNDYAVDSNVYVKISKLESFINMESFVNKIIEIGTTQSFYEMVNIYKPAAITIGWLRDFLDDYIEDNKIEK